MPNSVATGPFMINTWAAPPMVAAFPARLNSCRNADLTDATTTGKYSGRQPAITALMANFSRVTLEFLGCIIPSEVSGSPPKAESIARTDRSVGGTTGRPSVQPCSA